MTDTSISSEQSEVVIDGFVASSEVVVGPGISIGVTQSTTEILVAGAQQQVSAEIGSQAVEIGLFGVPGPRGARAGDETIIAGETLHAYRAVSIGVDGRGYQTDPTDPGNARSVFGIATSAAASDEVLAVRSSGPLDFSGWSWTPQSPVFVGNYGELTQLRPSAGALLRIGVATLPTQILVGVQSPIFL